MPIACSLLLNLPSVQDYAGRKLTGWLSGKLQTEAHDRQTAAAAFQPCDARRAVVSKITIRIRCFMPGVSWCRCRASTPLRAVSRWGVSSSSSRSST
ncbi:MAG: hypothetical protein ACLR8Y_00485 [Alistipes indistinctus]